MMSPARISLFSFILALTGPAFAAEKAQPLIVEAESGKFTGIIDRHSCWHNVMLTDEPCSPHSGRASVDTKNEVGSYIEVDYDALWSGPHRIQAHYTHTRSDPRRGELVINGTPVATLTMKQTVVLPAWKTDSAVGDLRAGKNVSRLRALDGGA